MLRLLLSTIVTFIVTGLLNTSVYSQQLTLDWGGSYPGNNSDVITGTSVDSQGNLYTVGYFKETVDFDILGSDYFMTTTPGPNGFVCKYGPTGALIWALQIEADTSILADIVVDHNADIYIGGSFKSNIDLDPGIPTAATSSTSQYDGFIVKLDSSGSYLWGSVFSGNMDNLVNELYIDDFNNLFVIGHYYHTVDVDGGVGITNLERPNNGNNTSYIAKYDSDGSYIWNFSNELSTENFFITGIGTMPDHDLFISGSFEGSLDFDPGPGDFIINSPNKTSFYLRLSSNGEFVWANKLSSSGSTSNGSIVVDNDGNIYNSGIFNGSINLSFTSTPSEFVSNGSYDSYLIKMDSMNNILWSKVIGNTGWDQYYSLALDGASFPVVFGIYENSYDIDPGFSVFMSSDYGGKDLFVQKFNPDGEVIWTRTLGSTLDDQPKDITIDFLSTIFIAGAFQGTIDVDPDTSEMNISSIGYSDCFIAKWHQDSCAYSYIQVDSFLNISCDTGPGEIDVSVANAVGDVSYFWNTTPVVNTDQITINSPGTYSVFTSDSLGCELSKTFLLAGPVYTSGYDLGIQVVATEFRPGFNTNVWLTANNYSCNPSDGIIKFVPDSGQTINFCNPMPDGYLDDTLYWNYSGIFYDAIPLNIHVNLYNSVNYGLGDNVCIFSEIEGLTADNNLVNDSEHYCDIVVNSYDPNDKNVTPSGICSSGFVELNQKLIYKIRFQNTGNAEAINVIVIDTITPWLNMNSLSLIATSHNVLTELYDWGAKFIFNNINLPDSTTNEVLSHGYIIFEIEPDSLLANGTTISNKSSIYFDFNSPIVTNSVTNTFVTQLPVLDTTLNLTSCTYINLNGVHYNNSGTYLQLLNSSYGCDSTITINLTITDVDVSTNLSGYTITANNASADNYQWVNCDNGYAEIIGETNQIFQPTGNGNYAVIVSENGCVDTSVCINISGLELKQNSNAFFQVYPNPVTDELNILLNENIKVEAIKLVDAKGNVVYNSSNIGQTNLVLNMSSYSAGVYTLIIVSEHTSQNIRLIKQ